MDRKVHFSMEGNLLSDETPRQVYDSLISHLNFVELTVVYHVLSMLQVVPLPITSPTLLDMKFAVTCVYNARYINKKNVKLYVVWSIRAFELLHERLVEDPYK